MADKRSMGGSDEDGIFFISGEQLEIFDEISAKIRGKKEFHETLSERFVSTELFQAVGKLRLKADSKNCETLLDELITNLSESIRDQIVYVPLQGIVIAGPVQETKFGCVTLFRMDETRLDEALGYSKTVFGNANADFLGRTVAAFECRAESTRAVEWAKEEVSRALDILWYAMPFFEHYAVILKSFSFGIDGTVPESRLCPVMRRERQEPGAAMDWESSSTSPFRLDQSTIQRVNDVGGARLSLALQKTRASQTDFEKIMLRAVHWFANAQIEQERENELLSLVTCLETFLTPKDGNPIGTAIAEGTALLLEEDLEPRKHMKKRVKELYNMRSGVSHGGEKAIPDAKLEELRDITKRFVEKMIGMVDNFESQKALLQHIEDKKLGP